MWADRQRTLGTVLISLTLVATLWLAITGQLTLYIHPRYVPFTVIMSCIGLVMVLASFAVGRQRQEHHHDHAGVDDPANPEDHFDDAPRSRIGRGVSLLGAALALAAGASLLVLPPETLSAATAAQRDVGSGAIASTQSLDAAASAPDDAFATFTVQDWSSLLRQTTDLSFYSGKPADVAGFVTPGADASDDVFWVSRFVITHCAIDAQPVAVPVHLENWEDSLSADQWVRVTGEFDTNPSSDSTEALALLPADVEQIEQPAEPYLY